MNDANNTDDANGANDTGRREAWAIWITGLPGSGKTTIAKKVCEKLGTGGVALKHLQLDRVRKVITPNPRYTDEEREIVYASLAYMAHILVESGICVVIDATANRRKYRDRARELIPHFVEVYVECPLGICVTREQARDAGYAPTGIYAQAGGSGTVPGVDVTYEAPLNPEIVVRSDLADADACADAIVAWVRGEM